jgi:hypothetical protein
MFKPKTLLILQVVAVILTIIVMAMQIHAIYESRKTILTGVN